MKSKCNPLLLCAAVCLAALITAVLPRAVRGADDNPLEIFAGIPPVGDFVQRIGGDHVNVSVLVPKGRDPHTFEPSPRQMVGLSNARLFFKVGMPFEERLVAKAAGGQKKLEVADIAEGVRKVPIEEHGGGAHGHGHGDEDGHGEGHQGGEAGEVLDPHVWLSPPLVKIQAANIRDALIAADPANAEDYRANFRAFIAEIESIDGKVRAMLEPFRGRTIYVFHPAFGYFADAYGLRQVAVETGGKSPTPRTLSALIEQARADGVKTIFVQPQFDTRSARAVADAIGGETVTLDDLPDDALSNFLEMASKISEALRGAPGAADER